MKDENLKFVKWDLTSRARKPDMLIRRLKAKYPELSEWLPDDFTCMNKTKYGFSAKYHDLDAITYFSIEIDHDGEQYNYIAVAVRKDWFNGNPDMEPHITQAKFEKYPLEKKREFIENGGQLI